VLTEGFQSAFLACVVLAAIGVALALVLLRRPRKAPVEPVPAAVGADGKRSDAAVGRPAPATGTAG
jgi:hypothetical protein